MLDHSSVLPFCAAHASNTRLAAAPGLCSSMLQRLELVDQYIALFVLSVFCQPWKSACQVSMFRGTPQQQGATMVAMASGCAKPGLRRPPCQQGMLMMSSQPQKNHVLQASILLVVQPAHGDCPGCQLTPLLPPRCADIPSFINHLCQHTSLPLLPLISSCNPTLDHLGSILPAG